MDLRRFDFTWISREAISAIRVAARRAGIKAIPMYGAMEMFIWPQEWPNASCGYPEHSPFEELTIADTAVFKDTISGVVCVTHCHKIAYTVVRPNAKFYKGFRQRSLLSASEYVGQYEEKAK